MTIKRQLEIMEEIKKANREHDKNFLQDSQADVITLMVGGKLVNYKFERRN